MRRNICVFCSSSGAVSDSFVEAARDLATECVKRHYTIVYGGTNVGLMGVLARKALELGGKVIGVIPQFLAEKGITQEGLTELVTTETIRERKEIMDERSDGFIALPGGLGTLEELFEVITLKQLKRHQKPIVLYNVDDCYNPLLAYLERLVEMKLLKPDYKELFYTASHARHAIHQFDSYRPKETEDKWIEGHIQ